MQILVDQFMFRGVILPLRARFKVGKIDKKTTTITSIFVFEIVSICVSEDFSIVWLEKLLSQGLGGQFGR